MVPFLSSFELIPLTKGKWDGEKETRARISVRGSMLFFGERSDGRKVGGAGIYVLPNQG